MSSVQNCMVINCRNNKKEHPEISFFSLPKKMEIADKWIEFSGRIDIDLRNIYHVCSEHFSTEHFKTHCPRELLYAESIPFLKGPHSHESTQINNDIAFESIEVPTSSDASGTGTLNNNEMVLEIEDIPSTSVLKNIEKKRIQKLQKRMNGLRFKLYTMNEPQCCKGRPISSIRKISSDEATIKRLIQESKRYLSKERHTLFVNGLRTSYVNKHIHKYNDSLKEMCLLWYYSSPKGYEAISKCLNLPTPRSLKNWQSKLKLSPGIISPVLIKSLMLHFSKNTEKKREVCSLMFKEIALSEELPFDRANTALVCMARGVAYNWKYVMGYWFLGDTATNEYLYSIVLDSIDAAQESGLKVKAIISNQSPVNQSVAKELGISTEQCFFFRNGEKIYFIYDTPDLLGSIRDNLEKYDLEYLGKTVSWKYIQDVCTSTNPLRARLLPKITGEHLNVTTFDAMRVEYAAQILSESVSVAILVLIQFQELPAESEFTSEFISDMDKAFDCLNSSKLEKDEDEVKMRYAMSEDSPHRDLLIKIRDNFRSCKFLSKTSSVPPCIDGFIITINSILQLADELRNTYNIPKLLTRRLNQDPLENFFTTVRQQHGYCQKPSPQQFENGLQNHYITLMSKLCSNINNCKKEITLCLEKLKELNHLMSDENEEEL